MVQLSFEESYGHPHTILKICIFPSLSHTYFFFPFLPQEKKKVKKEKKEKKPKAGKAAAAAPKEVGSPTKKAKKEEEPVWKW